MSLPYLWPSLSLLASLAAGADGPPPSVPAMTLEEAKTFAQSHNPTLASAHSRVTESQALAQVPREEWLPKIGGSAQLFVATVNNTTAVVAPSPALAIPRIGGRTATDDSWGTAEAWHPYASTFVGVGITQEIFDFGLLAARSAAADAQLAAERQRLTASTLDVSLAVTVSFLAVQAAHGVLEAASGAVKRAQAERDQAEASVRAGLVSPIFLDRAEADLARLEVGQVKAQGGLSVARTLFATTIGFPGPQLDAAGEAPTPSTLPDLTSSLQLAFSREPQLLALQQELRAEHEHAESVWARLRPNLQATATLSTRAGGAPLTTVSGGGVPTGSGWIPAVPNWDVGIIMSIPLFDPAISAAAHAAAAREERVQNEILEARTSVIANVSQAHELADQALRAVPSLVRALDAARRNYSQASARFKEGLGNSVELADAQALLTDADVQLALGRFETGRAEALFERAIGGTR